MDSKMIIQIAKKLDMTGMEFQEFLGKIERLSPIELIALSMSFQARACINLEKERKTRKE